jgi:hypothetical protein
LSVSKFAGAEQGLFDHVVGAGRKKDSTAKIKVPNFKIAMN